MVVAKCKGVVFDSVSVLKCKTQSVGQAKKYVSQLSILMANEDFIQSTGGLFQMVAGVTQSEALVMQAVSSVCHSRRSSKVSEYSGLSELSKIM